MLKGLNKFNQFDVESFLENKVLLYLKAESWEERTESGDSVRSLGSKVSVLIARDGTDYGRSNATNFGEILTVKVRDLDPEAFEKPTPMKSQLVIKNVERAVVFGEFRNQLSIVATVEVAK
ncbi:MAG: hypothetical protein ACLU37_09960 [Collinsella sp.]